MAASLDKNYKIIKMTPASISKNSFTTVFNVSGRGWLDCIILNLSDSDMDLIVEVDGVNVVDEFRLKDFLSVYDLQSNHGYKIPLTSIDSKTFKYQPRDWQQFDNNLTIKLKHASKSNKNLEAGYITYQSR